MKKEEYFKIGMIGALLILTVVVFVDVFSEKECDTTIIADNLSAISSSLDSVRTQVVENRQAIESLSVAVDNLEINSHAIIEGNEPKSNDSEIFLSMAEDKEETYRDMFYMAAISHDPQNSLYYSQYLDYIIEEGHVEALNLLGMLLESAISNSTPENINNLIKVYTDLQDLFIEENPILFGDNGRVAWEAAYDSFYAYSDSFFSYEEFLSYSDAVMMAYSSLTDKTPADDRAFTDMMNISSLIEKYKNIEALNDSLAVSTDQQFMDQYGYVVPVFDEAALSYALRNKEKEGNYYQVLDAYHKSLNNIINLNVNRYAVIKTNKLAEAVAVLAKKIETVSTYSTDTLLPDCIKEYTSLNNEFTMQAAEFRTIDVVQNRLATIGSDLAGIFSEIYQMKYSQYQQWAAEKIYTIKERLDFTKDTEMKLTVLASNGYWNIDRSLLIPQLQTAWDSLWDKKYEDKSVKPLDDILIKYPIEKRGIM